MTRSKLTFVFVVATMIGCAREEFQPPGEGESEGEGEACGSASGVRCSPDDPGIFQACTSDGAWVDAGECGGKCSGGKCGDPCTANDVRCEADGTFRECDPEALGWRFPAVCDAAQSCYVNDSGESCHPWYCPPNSLTCEGATAYQCDGVGSSSEIVQVCPEKCVSGSGCLTFCEAAEDRHTSEGCQFYLYDSDLADYDDGLSLNLLVGNVGTGAEETADVTLDARNADGTWATLATSSVGPQASLAWNAACSGGYGCPPALPTLGPDRHPEGTGVFSDKAFRITSTRPVVVYAQNSDDTGGASGSPNATIVLPVGAIEKKYMAITWPQCSSSYYGSGGDNAYVTIIAANDATDVSVRIGQFGSSPGGGEVPALAAGESFTTTLDEGDLLQISTATPGADMTGTYVEANNDIAVFSGNEDACPGAEGGGYTFQNDAIMEAGLPLVAWGWNYVAIDARWNTYATQAMWRVLASVDDTTVSFENPSGLPGVPAAPVVLASSGDFIEFTVTGNASNPGDFFISSDEDHPIQPAQVIEGQTAMVYSVPVEQFLPAYVFLTTPGYYNEQLHIMRIAGTMVTVDGAAPSGLWIATGGEDWEATQVTMATDATHTVTSTAGTKGLGVGIVVSGNGGSCSFSYIGGLNQERINPIGWTGAGGAF